MKKINKFEELFESSPGFIFEYQDFYTPNELDYTTSQYKALAHIHKFLKFYYDKNQLGPNFQEMTTQQLSEVAIEEIHYYLTSGPIKDYSTTSKKLVIQTLSAFWSYFTTDSYNVKTKKPIFYRHAINEWKIAYNSYYKELLNGKPQDSDHKGILYDQSTFEDMLAHFEKTYPLFLDTTLKRENWKKNSEKYLAVMGLLMGAGVTIEELCELNTRDIDLRKKGIFINRNNERVFVPIMDFAIPYISPYVSWRRNWWAASKSMPALFLNLRHQRVSTSFPNYIISKLSESYGKPLSASIIRTSHGVNLLKETNDIDYLRKTKGYTTFNRVGRYLQTG
ncbi:TPA: tyrosine-type recombinase/integrase [Streptococcus suis]|nr:tyrosine-type recombinase/integrase [Streptococcus suis]